MFHIRSRVNLSVVLMQNFLLLSSLDMYFSVSATPPSPNFATPLKFLLMVASDSSPDSSAVVPAVDQTLEEINRDTSILPGHHLEYILSDTSQCNETASLDDLFDITDDSSVVAVVGCGCSTATEEVAKVSHYLNLSVISYTSTSVVLSDRSVYRSFFRTVPSDELLVSAMATIMNFNRWTILSVLTELQPQYLELADRVQQRLMKLNIEVNSTLFHKRTITNFTNVADVAFTVFDARPHIFLPVGNARTQTLILCAAYHNGRYYPNYAWILLGHHETDWWKEHYMETNCSDTDMMKVLNRSLILIPYPDDQMGLKRIQEGDLYNVSAYASDAVRALAEALHNCLLNSEGSGVITSSCKGTDLDFNISFSGDTGSVTFISQNGNRVSSRTIVQQYQSVSANVVMPKSVGILQDSIIVPLTNSSIWPGGVPPDGTPTLVVSDNIRIPLAVVYSILGVIVLVSAAVCFIFNVVFRNRKIVKLTSPNLNYFLIVGVVMMTITNVVVPANNPYVVGTQCTVNSLFTTIGYDIVIAIAVVKTWRVYYIFRNPKPTKKSVKDCYLIMVVMLIAAVDLVVAVPLLTLGLVNGDVNARRSETPAALNEKGVLENSFFISCWSSVFSVVFFGLTVFYKLILHAVGLLLSQLISNVKVEILNDSRETVAAIFATTVLMLLGCVGFLALFNNVNNATIVWTLMLFLSALVNLLLTFVPKMIALYKDPQGEKVFQNATQNTVDSSGSIPTTLTRYSVSYQSARSTDNCALSQLTSLRAKVVQLEMELHKYKNSE